LAIGQLHHQSATALRHDTYAPDSQPIDVVNSVSYTRCYNERPCRI